MVKAYLRYEEAEAFWLVAASQARVSYDHSGKLLLAGALEQFLVWNVKQGRCVSNLTAPPAATGMRPPVTAVSPLPSSASLVAVGYKDGTRCVWDIRCLVTNLLLQPSSRFQATFVTNSNFFTTGSRRPLGQANREKE